MAKTYMFDLDGTLIDSVPSIKNALSKFFKSQHSTLNDEMFNILLPMGYERTSRYLVDILRLKISAQEVCDTIYNYLLEEYSTTISFKPFAIEFLQKLRKDGSKVVILSQSPHGIIEACLKNNGATWLFDAVLCAEDFGTDKSDPVFFEKALEVLGEEVSNVIYFEDSCVAINTAVTMGFEVYAIKDLQDQETFDTIRSLTSKIVYSYKDLI